MSRINTHRRLVYRPNPSEHPWASDMDPSIKIQPGLWHFAGIRFIFDVVEQIQGPNDVPKWLPVWEVNTLTVLYVRIWMKCCPFIETNTKFKEHKYNFVPNTNVVHPLFVFILISPLFSQFSSQLYPICSNQTYCCWYTATAPSLGGPGGAGYYSDAPSPSRICNVLVFVWFMFMIVSYL